MNTEKKPVKRVYVIEQQPFDYTPATVYGELTFLESERLAPHAPNSPNTWNEKVLHQIRKDLAAYVPGYDYIIPTGAPYRMLLVGMVLASRGKQHRILGWDNRQHRYLEYVVQI